MIRRIDLRGARDTPGSPVDYRTAVPRAELDVESALAVVRPICDAVRDRGVAAIVEFSARFDGVEQTDVAVPAEALTAALAALDPGVRAGLAESIRRLRTTCEAERESDVVTQLGPGARVTHTMVPVERVGLYVPGGLAPLAVQRDHERRAGPGRRRAVDRAVLLAPGRPRRPAASHDPRRVRAARHRRGLRGRRRAGDRDVRLWRRHVPAASTWSPGPATSTRSSRQAAAQGPRGDRLRGGADRDRGAGRRHRRAGVRGRRPALPGRARPARGRRAGHPPSGSPTRSRPSWTSRSP